MRGRASNPAQVRRDQSRRRAAALLAEPEVLALSSMLLVRDVRARFPCSVAVARNAVAIAKRSVAVLR